MGLQINTRVVGDVTIVELQGRATIGAGNDLLGAHLRQALDGGARKVLVSLAGCPQIDSSGISTIVRSFVTLTRTGGSLKLCGAHDRVHEVLEVTHLLGTIPHYDEEAAAVASFR